MKTKAASPLYQRKIKSPVGPLFLVANEKSLVALLWGEDDSLWPELSHAKKSKSHPVLDRVETQLREYFQGKRQSFEIPLEPYGGTEFQKQVWMALRKIPYGRTKSYSEIAHSVKRPKAVRAVGAANGRNPISIIVPCHRVIGKNGSLVGFGGGLDVKKMLLQIEGSLSN